MTETVDRAINHETKVEWWLADGVPGQGPRPEYLDDKYANLAEQAKAYKEVRKALGAQAGAPEAYDFGELIDHMDVSNPAIKDFMTYAKENKISQDAFTKTLKTFIDYDKARQPNLDEEVKKLGEDGAKRIETVQRWAENNLSEKSLKTIGEIGTRAEVIEMLDELRQYQHHQAVVIPKGDEAVQFKPLSKAEVQEEMIANYSKYKTDSRYRAEISAKFEQAVG